MKNQRYSDYVYMILTIKRCFIVVYRFSFIHIDPLKVSAYGLETVVTNQLLSDVFLRLMKLIIAKNCLSSKLS